MKLKQLIITSTLTASLALSSAVIADTNTLMAPTPQTAQTSQQKFSPGQVKQIEQIIQKYLIQNPQILVKASQALQKQMVQRQQSAALKAINGNIKTIFENPNSPTAGNVKGNTVLVEFFDYQCGHCKAMGPIIKKILQQNNNVKIIFKELPIFGANSRYAAQAALASVKQGKYYAFHNALLSTTDPLTPKKVMKVAKKVGLNIEQLKTTMNSEEIKQQLRQNFQLAQKLKIMGTPAFIVARRPQLSEQGMQISKVKFIPGAVPQATLQAEINAVK